MIRLDGRVVVVTGASRGIGAGVALELARRGARPVLVGRTRAALEERDDEIRELGGEATLAPLDLTRREHVDALGGMLFERFGRIDGLIHAAGDPGVLTPVAHMDPTVLQAVLGVDIVATQHLIRSLEALLRASDAGRALFLTCGITGPVPAFFGMPAAAKAGMEALVRAWAAELRQTKVTATLVDPGRVDGTRTDIRRYPGIGREKPRPVAAVAPLIVDLLSPDRAGSGEVVRL